MIILFPRYTLSAENDLTLVRARAERGEAEAINELGNAYASGNGVPQNFEEAKRLYTIAAEKGVAAAHFNLGMMHELGRGVPADVTTAFDSYLNASRLGFAPAQFNVGNMYANGVGVKQDFFEAAVWFRQAADRNIAEAQYNLALAYELGRGVTKNETAAIRWYRAAAAQRFARAQYNLALMLEEGRGAPVNLVEAVELYRAAAEQNFLPAQNNLGILLAEGRGTSTNPVEAYSWLALAVENGAKPDGRDIVAQQLSLAQMAEARVTLAKLRGKLRLTEKQSIVEPVAVVPGSKPSDKASPVAQPPPGSRPSSDDIEQLKREIFRLTRAAADLTHDKSLLEKRLTASETRFTEILAKESMAKTQSNVTAVKEIEYENLASQLSQAKATLAEARRSAEQLATENTRLKMAAPTDPTPATNEVPSLLSKMDELMRAAATLRSEKAELQRRAVELAAELQSAQAAAPASNNSSLDLPDTRGIPLQELASKDRRIAKLLADNARLQDYVKRSMTALTELGMELRKPEERTATREHRSAPTALPAR